jgi:hypothetical protein
MCGSSSQVRMLCRTAGCPKERLRLDGLCHHVSLTVPVLLKIFLSPR